MLSRSSLASAANQEILIVSRVDQLERISDGGVVHSSKGNTLTFGNGAGGVSRSAAPVAAGDWIKMQSTVSMAKRGNALPIGFGPVFYNANGKIVQSWQYHPMPTTWDGQSINARIPCPAGAVLVRIGVLGPYAEGAKTEAMVAFSSIRMFRERS